MAKLPTDLSGRQVRRAFERAGFEFRRQRGSHMILRRTAPPASWYMITGTLGRERSVESSAMPGFLWTNSSNCYNCPRRRQDHPRRPLRRHGLETDVAMRDHDLSWLGIVRPANYGDRLFLGSRVSYRFPEAYSTASWSSGFSRKPYTRLSTPTALSEKALANASIRSRRMMGPR